MEAEEEKGLGFRCLRLASYPGLDNHNRLLFPCDNGGGELLLHLELVKEGLQFGRALVEEDAQRGAVRRGTARRDARRAEEGGEAETAEDEAAAVAV